MANNYGIRYAVVAAGAPGDEAEDEDIELIARLLGKDSPFKVTVLSEDVSDTLTVALLRERGTG